MFGNPCGHGKEQDPKSPAAVRDVDIPEKLASLLAEFIGDRKDGLLFCTASGKALCPRNFAPRCSASHPAEIEVPANGVSLPQTVFVKAYCKMSEARALLVDYWMAHENREMGTRYAKTTGRERRMA